MEYLKKANPPTQSIDRATSPTVQHMLDEIETHREEAARKYARDLDGYTGEIVLGAATTGRPHHRIGNRYSDMEEMKAEQGA